MKLEPDDFKRLAVEVRRFLAKGDILTRMAGMAQLYLEFPDVGSMHNAHKAILQSMQPGEHLGPTERYVDDHTIALEPFAGVSIILTCKQRFATTARGSLGYRDIAFKTMDLPPRK